MKIFISFKGHIICFNYFFKNLSILEGMRKAENLERKEQWSLPPRRAFFQGDEVVWMQVDFLHGDKFFQHFYLHIPRQLGTLVLSAEPALGT